MPRIFLLLSLCFTGNAVWSQWQAGFSGGIANYQGDLAEKIFIPGMTRGFAGVHVRYELSQRIMLRAGLGFASVAGHDKYASSSWRRQRNLNFQTGITEGSLLAEIHTFKMDDKRFSPYVFGGLALFRYNPYTYDGQNEKQYLQPLGTEGQGLPGYDKEPYALNQWAIPFGGGLRFNLTPKIIVGAEIGIRKLFTDYLDDVSTSYAAAADLLQYRGATAVALAYRADELPGGSPIYPSKGTERGGPKYNDYYYFSALSLSFRLGDGGRYGSDSRRSGYGCPPGF